MVRKMTSKICNRYLDYITAVSLREVKTNTQANLYNWYLFLNVCSQIDGIQMSKRPTDQLHQVYTDPRDGRRIHSLSMTIGLLVIPSETVSDLLGSGPPVTSCPLYLKGPPTVSLLNFSPLLSKLNYTLHFLLLTLLFQRKKDRSLPDRFLYLCPWPTPSLSVLPPTTSHLALFSFPQSLPLPWLLNSLWKCSRLLLSKDLSLNPILSQHLFSSPKILLSFSNSCI